MTKNCLRTVTACLVRGHTVSSNGSVMLRVQDPTYCPILNPLPYLIPIPKPRTRIPNPNRSGGRTNGLVTCPYKYAPLVACEQVKLHHSKITVAHASTYYSGFVARAKQS